MSSIICVLRGILWQKHTIMRYMIVAHNFWMGSKGWKIWHSKAKTEREAYEEAMVFKAEREGTFSHWACEVIEIANHERLRRLSFRERLTGKMTH